MALQYTYSTHALPSPRTTASPPPNFPSITRRYAALRLEALLTSPKAFGSTHAIESNFTPEEWANKIWRDDAVVLVCVAHPAAESDHNSGEAPTLDGEWVGSAILRGPIPGNDYALPPDSGAPPFGSDDTETKWQMTAVFASAAHRGRGLGKLLIQAGKDYAMVQTPGLIIQRPAKARLRVLIHPDNLAVLSLYSGTGFVDVARTTGQEAYRTNGDLSSWDLKLQSLTDDLKVHWKTAKVAVVMEWLGEVE
ncbi:N-acetyltransferase domain-containing protein [Mycena venus]|uniref:N-acetyltransferase domain-containing protein n=1 Tax=Mycena venus TaxID=2733690 RepID=A0A8H6YVF4_9AGAR|nr:N-acetyltransferase domain-containing protein [Mycena venus]